jgi:hypothetical protein
MPVTRIPASSMRWRNDSRPELVMAGCAISPGLKRSSTPALADAVFRPDAAEIEWARDVLAKAERFGASFREASESMADEAGLRRARDILSTD